jgi:hypothetical protein
MSIRTKQRSMPIILTAILVNGALQTNALASTDACGQARLADGTVGVHVTQNTCGDKSRISAGSNLELSTGSRLWLKFDPSATGESFQLICQNKSTSSISVNLVGTDSPWIAPQGVKSCSQWGIDNKLSCHGIHGERDIFFCAIASNKTTLPADAPKPSTSVKLRGSLPEPVSVEDMIKIIDPEIQLCKNLYGIKSRIEMMWTITSSGMIKDLQVNSEHKDLIDCVESVANRANASQELTIRYTF